MILAYKFVSVMVSKMLLKVLDKFFGKRFSNMENVHKMKKTSKTQKNLAKMRKMHELAKT